MVNMIIEVTGQEEEDDAFYNGADIVIRLDLLPDYVPPPPPPPPQGQPSLTINFNSNFNDASSYAHTVNINGTPSAANNYGDFTNGYLTVADSTELRFGTNDFELSLDFRLKSALPTGTHSFMCSKGASGNLNNAWYLALLSGGKIGFVPANNSAAIYVNYPYFTDYTNFHTVKLSRVAGVISLYVDNVLMGTTNATIFEGTGTLFIGRWNYTSANTRGDYIDNFSLIPVV